VPGEIDLFALARDHEQALMKEPAKSNNGQPLARGGKHDLPAGQSPFLWTERPVPQKCVEALRSDFVCL
jgi:hypothetical protein